MVENFSVFSEGGKKSQDQKRIEEFYNLQADQDFFEYILGRMDKDGGSPFFVKQAVADLNQYYPEKQFGYRKMSDSHYEIFQKNQELPENPNPSPKENSLDGVLQEDGQYRANFPERKISTDSLENLVDDITEGSKEWGPLFIEDVPDWRNKMLMYQLRQDIDRYMSEGRHNCVDEEAALKKAEMWNETYPGLAKAVGAKVTFPGGPRFEDYQDILDKGTNEFLPRKAKAA